MAKITVHENELPTAAVAPATLSSNQVKDAKGRLLTMRELDPVQESRLTVAVGPEMAMNVMYMNLYAFPVAAVAEIDGEEYPVPQNPRQVETLLAILGKQGLKAASGWLRERARDDEELTEAAAKN
ncbi:hypothetical protein [Pantoea piersonii]|jgi:hypothetical protein|uniref:hypothetical protein n=1 Tax=Pantoea piersonii TaxID=2364647 RepID=UPI000EA34584|nr:hypothetical protein [Pantoea piersonii]MBZ6386797.1 hypothetical protein [Pantoea piersonii]MBZ6400054.1 hypothetical protein [Pantoea piersonii]MBZ6409108.1 hypothetical protein [Pantoea piersonii]MBZ6426105.1 hypothetical protein [Pantoea piersonii]NYB04670.1 hypothetical protein [Pantoea piersonii]